MRVRAESRARHVGLGPERVTSLLVFSVRREKMRIMNPSISGHLIKRKTKKERKKRKGGRVGVLRISLSLLTTNKQKRIDVTSGSVHGRG